MEKEFSQKTGEPAVYLQTEAGLPREEDVFEAYSGRDRLLGSLRYRLGDFSQFRTVPEKTAVLTKERSLLLKLFILILWQC